MSFFTKSILVLFFSLLVLSVPGNSASGSDGDSTRYLLPTSLQRSGDISRDLQHALKRGLKGYEHFDDDYTLNGKLVVVDFTQPSYEERLYVIDLLEGELLYKKHVAHGKNSGTTFARHFSNKKNSHTSSLGFYRTAEAYRGKHGLSLRLDGLENQINHNARERAIVIHSAKYANPDFIKKYGRLGRSYGCPALPEKDYLEILDIVKEGALLYIHYPDQAYFQKSKI